MTIIAAEITDLDGQTVQDYIETSCQDACDLGDTDPLPPPRLIDMRARIDPGHTPPHQAAGRAIMVPWALAAAIRPPP